MNTRESEFETPSKSSFPETFEQLVTELAQIKYELDPEDAETYFIDKERVSTLLERQAFLAPIQALVNIGGFPYIEIRQLDSYNLDVLYRSMRRMLVIKKSLSSSRTMDLAPTRRLVQEALRHLFDDRSSFEPSDDEDWTE